MPESALRTKPLVWAPRARDSIAQLFRVVLIGVAPKERRRSRVEKQSSKRVFLESPSPLCPLRLSMF